MGAQRGAASCVADFLPHGGECCESVFRQAKAGQSVVLGVLERVRCWPGGAKGHVAFTKRRGKLLLTT